METLFQGFCLAMGLPSGERLEGHQEGEDAGGCRRDQDHEHEHSQGHEHNHDLGGWRQLLELLQEFLEMHGFPFLSISDILRQTSWCSPFTRGSACLSHIAMLEKRIAVFGLGKAVLVVQKGVLVVQWLVIHG